MTEDEAGQTRFMAQLFSDKVAQQYPQFAQEERLYAFMQRRLARETTAVAEFVKNSDLIVRRIVARPNEQDNELVTYAVSVLNGTHERETSPIDISEPFVRYLNGMLDDLDWIDWGNANKSIGNPLQAIRALHEFNHAHDDEVPMLDGLELGKRIAQGENIVSITAQLGSREKEQLDKAALFYNLATESDLKLVKVPHDAMPLGEQLFRFREAFLTKLREEWQLSQMFLPNADRSNVFIDSNALANARGKAFPDLLDDPSIKNIPGFGALHPSVRERLVKQKLDRMGESTHYRFGSLQHGIDAILKRSLLMQGKVAPPSYSGTEAQMVEQFLNFCRTWDAKEAVMLNPKIMLAQYLAQAGGENVTAGAATTQQKIETLETYLKERWLANYGEPPAPFDRRAAALNILKKAFGDTKAERDLTEVKQEFSRPVIGSPVLEERKFQTPLDRFLYLADNPALLHEWFQFSGKIFYPHAQLQGAEDSYNEALAKNPKVIADAKENIRKSERVLNDKTFQAELDTVIRTYRTETEADRGREEVLRVIRATPFAGNLWRFGEGIYRGDADEIIGAIPVVGNVYEFEEGIRHNDTGRAISAIPIIGSGYQLEEAFRHGDSMGVRLSAMGFVFDLSLLSGGVSRSGIGLAEHSVLREAELPTGYAVGLRSYLSLSKTLGIPLKENAERAAVPGENVAAHAEAGFVPGDPYGIESLVTHEDIPATGADPVPSGLKFGEKMNKYRVAGPASGIEPNAEGIYREGNHRYIKVDHNFYRVEYDDDNRTWRVYYRENRSAPAVPVRYKDGHWWIHNDVGLKGGSPDSLTNDEISLSLFNPEMASKDRFLSDRKRTIGEMYQQLKHSDKPYEGTFDVEGRVGGHQQSPEVHPGTGKTYFDIRTHGSPTKVLSFTGKVVGAKEFAKDFTQYVKYYQRGTPIRLLVCEAGKGGTQSFAQQLANELNVPVRAYKADVNLSKPADMKRFAKVFEPVSRRGSLWL